jgi:ligand-binding SRPBCC domain-containing protein
MRFQIKTEVNGHYMKVMSQFDRQLFEALKPSVGKMEILEFTGSKKGDRVHLQFLQPIKAEWLSIITDDGANETEAYFIDEGELLPPGLSYWKHKHIVRKLTENTSLIIDDITFKGSVPLLTPLLFPALYFSFLPRKKVYQSYFKMDIECFKLIIFSSIIHSTMLLMKSFFTLLFISILYAFCCPNGKGSRWFSIGLGRQF